MSQTSRPGLPDVAGYVGVTPGEGGPMIIVADEFAFPHELVRSGSVVGRES